MKITPIAPRFGSSFILTMHQHSGDVETLAKKLPLAIKRANTGLYDPKKFYFWADPQTHRIYVVCHDEDDKFFRRSADEHFKMLYHWGTMTGLYIWISSLARGKAVTSQGKFEEAVAAVKRRQPPPPEANTEPVEDSLRLFRDFFDELENGNEPEA